MKNNLYIMFGKTGKYKETTSWIVAGFFDLELALNYLERCQKRANEIYSLRLEREKYISLCWETSIGNPQYQNQYDKRMLIIGTPPKYEIDIIELID